MDRQQVKYQLAAFRTKRSYLLFLVAQVLLAIVIVVVALSSKQHFRTPIVIALEIILFLTLAVDLLLIRWVSDGSLCDTKTKIMDLALLLLFAATLLFLIFTGGEKSSRDYKQALDTEDVLVLTLVIARYVAQIARLICVINKAKTNRKLHHQLKQLNLNENHQGNQTVHFHDALQTDKLVTDKIKAKHWQQEL